MMWSQDAANGELLAFHSLRSACAFAFQKGNQTAASASKAPAG